MRALVLPLVAATLLMSQTPLGAQEATPNACPATTEAENIEIARVWHEQAINNQDMDALEAVLAPDVVHHAAGGYPDVTDAAGVMTMMRAFPAAFSDLHYTIDFWVTQDDMVVERYTATGTQDGPLGDQPPTGRMATWTGVNIFRIECGQIVEAWSEVDALSRNAQLFDADEAVATPAAD
ncbi:MAG: ester cyclase [Thermomicrobiales bacterium]|nr:ester cyclase [Thermomicrobiales bacterium]